MTGGILALVSVAINALTAIFAPVIARKMTKQQERLATAENTLELVGAGLRVVEQAVEDNKDALASTGAGDAIAKTIRSYGPAARTLVDTARAAAKEMRESAVETYENETAKTDN